MADATMKAALAQMRPEYAHCRDYGHQWNPLNVYDVGRSYERLLRCGRCGTQCSQEITKKGGRLVGGRRYTYPDDYQIKGMGYVSAEDRGFVRLASILADQKVVAA